MPWPLTENIRFFAIVARVCERVGAKRKGETHNTEGRKREIKGGAEWEGVERERKSLKVSSVCV